MNFTKSLLLASALVLSTVSAAQAGSKVLTSPPVQANAMNRLWCDAQNVGGEEMLVTFEIVDNNGAIVSSIPNFSLLPDHGFAIGYSTDGAYCRFTLISGKTKNVRAVAAYDDGTGYTAILPAY